MALILNIDTSNKICSVSLSKDGEIIQGFESSQEMDHSASLAPFVKACLEKIEEIGEKLDAVGVTIGPGSYTGLRIGLSMAKGICFGLEIPLIGVSTLEVMSVRAMFTYPGLEGDELIVPMIDARRMEVFSGVYDTSLICVMDEKPLILEAHTFIDLTKGHKILFIGDGTEKFKSIFKGGNVEWIGAGMPHAKYMPCLTEKFYKEKRFSDVAYTIPSYLKEYQLTQPKNILS